MEEQKELEQNKKNVFYFNEINNQYKDLYNWFEKNLDSLYTLSNNKFINFINKIRKNKLKLKTFKKITRNYIRAIK